LQFSKILGKLLILINIKLFVGIEQKYTILNYSIFVNRNKTNDFNLIN